MKDFVTVNISTDHNYECGTEILARAGEGSTTSLYITLPEALLGYDTYLDFEKPNGETIRTPKLEATNGVASYDVSPYILTEHGELKVQLVLQGASGEVWKSSVKRYIIQKSINAVEAIPDKEDFITQAQALIDELSGEVQEIADALASDAEFADAVIEACGGQTKINTVNGKALKFWLGTQEQYDDIEVKDSTTLYYIEDDQTLEDIYKDIQKIINGTTPVELSNTSYALYSKDALEEAKHLDNLVTAGRYYCDWSVGTPNGSFGFVEVFRRISCTMQVFYEWGNGNIYVRKTSEPAETDKEWTEWKQGTASFAQKANKSTYTQRFAIDGDYPHGSTIESTGLYLVSLWSNTGNRLLTDWIFITDLSQPTGSVSLNIAYDANLLSAQNGCTIHKVFKLGDYTEGTSAG